MSRSVTVAIWTALTLSCSLSCSIGLADTRHVPISTVTPVGEGKSIGAITLTDTRYGLLIAPDLHGLPPGIHGLHVHEKPDCGDDGHAAGEHLDPKNTGHHLGPYAINPEGHLGDLPALTVDQNGRALLPVLAPRVKISDIVDHALIVHAGGDTYSDTPPVGGGGMRMYCGLIK